MSKTDRTTSASTCKGVAESLAAPPASGAGLCTSWKRAGDVAVKTLWPFMVIAAQRSDSGAGVASPQAVRGAATPTSNTGVNDLEGQHVGN